MYDAGDRSKILPVERIAGAALLFQELSLMKLRGLARIKTDPSGKTIFTE